ncbi:hypothetical protein SAMN06265365_11480 [Tistlia consotensis]|uniref:Uncharacterized protein n=1 Tax=Tistlia consotensis USBA 355 TaxID=560819 RepID=A0A1Y6BAE6_9PROT|nr:hypothetical protein [Tistlia consotensis]SME99435.1 hypothetical protein SAMN05428998_102283 [Tistlia consotensis USBA 355]SNR76808.1 hypothetical protein SAMN06265365_11480 [Tistlia consotensis]
MPKPKGRWVWVRELTKEQKAEITAVCERFIANRLKPRFLPVICPTQFNYAVDILGRWRGHRYSFITRFRSGFPDNLGEEFDSAFTRLDHRQSHLAEPRFDVFWHRHTGQWFRLHGDVPLEEALNLIEDDELLHPLT